MDKKALLTKLIIDDTLTQQRIPVHEELVIALYEDTKIAQHGVSTEFGPYRAVSTFV